MPTGSSQDPRAVSDHQSVLALRSKVYLLVCPGSKEQGPTPVEKKKKGKRKNEIPVDSLDLDQDLLSPSVQSPEESAESADSQVWPKPLAGCWLGKSWLHLSGKRAGS